jgi:drug/metabolite transporter (DMT)-like permease
VSPSAPHISSQRRGAVVATMAVLCFSTSPVFVLAANATFSPLEIAFWRVLIASGFVGALGFITRTSMRLRRGEWRRFILYGLALALHLACYVASLSFTSIAHAVALTYTSPIFITILAAIFLRERPTTIAVLGLVVAVIGIGILSGFQPNYGQCDVQHGHCAVLGDGLALGAAIFASIYSVVGRLERERQPLFRYTFYVYGFAALWLAPLEIVLAGSHAYSLPAVSAVIALGLVPLGMGHTLYNSALRHTNATLVNLIATQEITGGIILGAIFFHQIPTLISLAGVAVTLIGIVVVMIHPTHNAGDAMIMQPAEI